MPVRLFHNLKDKAAELLRKYPMAVSAAFSVLAILPFFAFYGDLPVFLIGCFAAVPLLASILVFTPGQAFCYAGIPALFSFISASLLFYGMTHDPLDQALGREFCSAEAEFTVMEPSASPVMEPLAIPRNMLCRVNRFRWTRSAPWIDGQGSMVLFQYTGKDTFFPGYGDVFLAEGSFRVPEQSAIEGTFDFDQWMFRKRAVRLFFSHDVKKLSTGTGPRRTLLDIRDVIFNRGIKHFHSDVLKSLAGSIFFGRKAGLSYDTKQTFLRSGAIHLLSVSGTHVAIVAMIVICLFRFLSFRIRSAAVIVVTWLYAMSTGMAEPAFRAWFMLSVFLLTGMILIRSHPVNSLLTSFTLLLVLDPSNLINPGFYYSFLTVFALLLCSGKYGLLTDPEKRWIPRCYLSPWTLFLRERKKRFLITVFVCLAAFLVTVPLSMHWQGMFLPASIAANMIVIPLLTFLIFPAFGISILIGFLIPPLSQWLTYPAEYLLGLLVRICDIFANITNIRIPPPGGLEVFLFIVFFFTVMISNRNAVRITAAAAMTLMGIFWYMRSSFMTPETLILSGGGVDRDITVIAASPDSHHALVMNVPDFGRANEITAFLLSRGINSIDVLIPYGRKSMYGGVRYLANRFRFRKLIIPADAQKKFPYPAGKVMLIPKSGVVSDGLLTVLRSALQTEYQIWFPSGTVSGVLKVSENGTASFSGTGIPPVNISNCQTPSKKMFSMKKD